MEMAVSLCAFFFHAVPPMPMTRACRTALSCGVIWAECSEEFPVSKHATGKTKWQTMKWKINMFLRSARGWHQRSIKSRLYDVHMIVVSDAWPISGRPLLHAVIKVSPKFAWRFLPRARSNTSACAHFVGNIKHYKLLSALAATTIVLIPYFRFRNYVFKKWAHFAHDPIVRVYNIIVFFCYGFSSTQKHQIEIDKTARGT